jgi:hypothetical protein
VRVTLVPERLPALPTLVRNAAGLRDRFFVLRGLNESIIATRILGANLNASLRSTVKPHDLLVLVNSVP